VATGGLAWGLYEAAWVRLQVVPLPLLGLPAEDHLRLAHYTACEEWNARQFLGGDADPSPQIRHAVAAGCTLLEARCPQCRTTRYVNLTEVIWPRDKSVHTLRGVLYCEPCRAASGRKLRPDLVALCMPAPTDHPLVAARAAKRT